MKPPRLTPLHMAIDKFATKQARASLERPAKIAPEDMMKRGTTREEAAKRLPSLLSLAAKEFLRPSFNRRQLFEHLCSRIVRGELVAYGVRTKPTVGSDQELVPSILFRYPEWDGPHDAIENAGQRFELIEIGRPLRVAAKEPIETRQSKKMGRPTKEAEIEEIVRVVLADPSTPRNRHAQCYSVRELAAKLGKNVDAGYSDSTIKRLIVRAEAQLSGSIVQK
jgi:hypothetical protein